MKASVFMARFLRSQGLERAFGLPGGEAVPLMEGLRQVDVPFVLTHHESAAGYAAGTTGLLTGVPGLCIVKRGPGAVNAVSGVATPIRRFSGLKGPYGLLRRGPLPIRRNHPLVIPSSPDFAYGQAGKRHSGSTNLRIRASIGL